MTCVTAEDTVSGFMSSELGVQGSRAGALPSSTMTIRGRGGVPEALTPVTFSLDCVTCYVANYKQKWNLSHAQAS